MMQLHPPHNQLNTKTNRQPTNIKITQVFNLSAASTVAPYISVAILVVAIIVVVAVVVVVY
jgi:hypothetical protein